jgi:hypothetical protein
MRFRSKDKYQWNKWVAWFPVKVEGRELVWLEVVERKWNLEKNFRIIDWIDPGDYDGGWEYRHFLK